MNRATNAILYVVLLPFALFGLNFILIQVTMYNLAHADHQSLLQACRELIARRHTYKNTSGEWRVSHPEIVLLDPTVAPLDKDIPEIVRKMNPEIAIGDDYVTLFPPHPPLCRMGILGFRNGAKQFGTFQYIEGLWFWNGSDNTLTNNGPVAQKQAMIAFASSPPLLNVGQKAGLTLALIGCVGWLLSYLFFTVRAFKVSWLWGLSVLVGGVFLIPFFACYQIKEAKLPYTFLLLSFASVFIGVAIFIAAGI